MKVYCHPFALALVLLARFIDAFSSGAGQCVTGKTSVSGPHLSLTNTNVDASLAGLGVSVTIGGDVILDPAAPTAVDVGDGTLTISLGSSSLFRGFLIAVHAPDKPDLVLDMGIFNDAAQLAGTCTTPLAGITHTDSSEKNAVSAFVSAIPKTEATLLLFDVTVVVANSDVSTWGYNNFTVDVRGVAQSKMSLGSES